MGLQLKDVNCEQSWATCFPKCPKKTSSGIFRCDVVLSLVYNIKRTKNPGKIYKFRLMQPLLKTGVMCHGTDHINLLTNAYKTFYLVFVLVDNLHQCAACS